MNQEVVQRNELEAFKQQLLDKINARFQDHSAEELLDIIPGSLGR